MTTMILIYGNDLTKSLLDQKRHWVKGHKLTPYICFFTTVDMVVPISSSFSRLQYIQFKVLRSR